MTVANENLLEKVAKRISEASAGAPAGVGASILTLAAASFGLAPDRPDETVPTGFDPTAAALFESIVEAAYLVANADGDFDATERHAFERVVLQACGGAAMDGQIKALIADLADQLDEDGIDKRIQMVARTVGRVDQQQEVLRIAGLLAHVSDGVSESERDVLNKLATAFGLDAAAVPNALEEVRVALA